jgi:hypothetical protein
MEDETVKMTITKRIQIAAGAVLINGMAAFSLLSAPPASAGTCTPFFYCLDTQACVAEYTDELCYFINPGCIPVTESYCGPSPACPGKTLLECYYW